MTETKGRVAFVTLGCKLNQFESDALASDFRQAGYEICKSPQGADICVVNACTVTDSADRKSHASLRRALKVPAGPALVVLTGCFAPDSPARLARAELEADGRTLIVDSRLKSHVRELVEARLRGEDIAFPAVGNFDFKLADQAFHTRASIKIQDGCDSFCSYCIIPFARGSAISRPQSEILAEIRQLLDRSCREIILTGVNMSRYQDGRTDFTGLVRSILELEPPVGHDFRLRLGSMEPQALSKDFSALFAHPRLCPSLHLCLQSGSDRILKVMKRDYQAADFQRIVSELRSIDPNFSLSTDLITGFPGESQADFELSQQLISLLRFAHVHVFPYSPRSTTAAANLPDQVPEALRLSRAETIRAADFSQRRRWLEGFLGLSLDCLVEDVSLEKSGSGQDCLQLCGRSQYGSLLKARMPLARADLLLVDLNLPLQPRLPTPKISHAQLGSYAGLWNTRLRMRIVAISDQESGNPEPFLQAEID